MTRYYFNPNAQPDILYPIIPLLTLLTDEVVVYNPDPKLIEEHLSESLFYGLVAGRGRHGRVRIVLADYHRRALEAKPDPLGTRIVDLALPFVRTAEQKDQIRSLSKDIYDGMDPAERGVFDDAMRRVSDRLSSLRHQRATLEHFYDDAQRYRMPIQAVLLDSLVQDWFVFAKVGANIPLCDPYLWQDYRRALDIFYRASARAGPLDDGIRSELDEDPHALLERLTAEVGTFRHDAEEWLEERLVLRRFAEGESSFRAMDYAEFLQNYDAMQNVVERFRTFQATVMREDLKGSLRERVNQILTKNAAKEAAQRAAAQKTARYRTIGGLASDGIHLSAVATGIVGPAVSAALKLLLGLFDTAVSERNHRRMKPDRRIRHLFGGLSNLDPLFLQDPAKWLPTAATETRRD